MDKWVKYAEKKGVNYAELKDSEVSVQKVEVHNKKTKSISDSNSKIVSARVIYAGKQGLAFNTMGDFKAAINQAIKFAKSNPLKSKLADSKPTKTVMKAKYKIHPEDISLEEKKKLLLGLQTKYKQVKKLEKMYLHKIANTDYINTQGSSYLKEDLITGLVIQAYSQQGNQNEHNIQLLRHHKGYEILKDSQNFTNKVTKLSTELLKAKFAKGGNFPVVVDQKLGGVFVHEAVGHACEADFVIGKMTVLQQKYLNKQIANKKVSISDDGRIEEHGWMTVDDEGVKKGNTQLIKNGILKGYLHSKETAAQMKVAPTGNGRAQSAAHRVIPRMTNTFMERGKDKFENMISSIKKGYYLKDSKGGQVDTVKGEFLFGTKYGYEINNGEIGKMVKNASLIGNILDILPKISMVGNDALLWGGGVCGKHAQHVPVSDSTPGFKISEATVGGK
jgi:TldD protein